MKAYINLFKMRLIYSLQYRAAAIAGISTQLFFGAVFILIYLAFYESGGNSSLPMNWEELITYLWLQQTFFALTYPWIADQELINDIESGNVAYELVRPQNIFLKFYAKTFASRLAGCLLRCVPVFLIAILLPKPYKLMLPKDIQTTILFIFSLILACLIACSLCMIVHFVAMKTLQIRGVSTTYQVIAELFMGSLIPLPFLPGWLRNIANVLPFRYMGDFPYRIYSGNISFQNGICLFLISILWFIILTTIGYVFSKQVLKKAVIQGG